MYVFLFMIHFWWWVEFMRCESICWCQYMCELGCALCVLLWLQCMLMFMKCESTDDVHVL